MICRGSSATWICARERYAYLGTGDDADGGVRRVGELGEGADGSDALDLALLLLGIVSCAPEEMEVERTGWTGVTSLSCSTYHFSTCGSFRQHRSVYISGTRTLVPNLVSSLDAPTTAKWGAARKVCFCSSVPGMSSLE